MYAKSLIPSEPPVAALLCTTSDKHIVGQLLDHHWSEFGQAPAEPAGSLLRITPGRLQLEVDGQVILADSDPLPPDGWWRAIDGQQGRCAVVVVPADAVDLHDPGAGATLQTLMDEPGSGAWALIPVTHSP